jgi:imidazolonepropionase-like amidohydrolase
LRYYHYTSITTTYNPALYFNIDKTHGTVSKGKIAHLVLLSEDPLKDIANTQKIEMVILRGKLYTRNDLDDLLAKIKKMVVN